MIGDKSFEKFEIRKAVGAVWFFPFSLPFSFSPPPFSASRLVSCNFAIVCYLHCRSHTRCVASTAAVCLTAPTAELGREERLITPTMADVVRALRSQEATVVPRSRVKGISKAVLAAAAAAAAGDGDGSEVDSLLTPQDKAISKNRRIDTVRTAAFKQRVRMHDVDHGAKCLRCEDNCPGCVVTTGKEMKGLVLAALVCHFCQIYSVPSVPLSLLP